MRRHSHPILVIGLDHTLTKATVRRLCDLEFTVRVVSDETTASPSLPRGVEVVKGDIARLDTLRKAVSGVFGVVFGLQSPSSEAALNFAIAGVDEGVRAVVHVADQWSTEFTRRALSLQRWRTEQLLDWANIGAEHLRVGILTHQLPAFTGLAVGDHACLPFADSAFGPIIVDDLAKVIVAILRDPEPHTGERYSISGPDVLSGEALLAAIGRGLGRAVPLNITGPLAWRAQLATTDLFDAADDWVARLNEARAPQSAVATDVVQRLAGQAPTSVETYARANRSAFSAESAGEI